MERQDVGCRTRFDMVHLGNGPLLAWGRSFAGLENRPLLAWGTVLWLPGERSFACLGNGPLLAWGRSFVYGVLSLSTEFYLCLCSSIFVYGVLSLSTEFYLCMRLLGACIWKRLGACMRLLGASLTAADSLPDSR